MYKVKFIYNPNSGEGAVAKVLDTIIEKYQNKDFIIIPFRITKFKNID